MERNSNIAKCTVITQRSDHDRHILSHCLHFHAYSQKPHHTVSLSALLCRTRRRMTTGPSRSGARGPSRSSSRRPKLATSSCRPSTPASRPTRATCALPCACPITRWRCRPTRRRPSCHRCERAPASTSPPSSPLWQPALKCSRRPPCPSRPLAASCAPVSDVLVVLSSCGS